MMEEGVCQPSKSPWASPLHIVGKKDGGIRPCGDYRRLNSQTIPDRYAVPNLYDFTVNLDGTKIFSTLDIVRAYFHIPIAPEDIPKTAIITPFGLYEFKRMCFGLRNAAQTFQRFMDQIFRDLQFVFVYLDDILIGSNSYEEHKIHLKEVFLRLDKHGLTLNPSKCVLGKEEVDFLGYTVNRKGIKPQQKKIQHILDIERPTVVKQLRSFLGMINFYRKCIPNAAELQRPLNLYLHHSKKNDKTPIEWTDEAIQSFESCKNCLANAVQLAHPSINAELSLACDASNTGIGAVLQQKKNEVWEPLGFFSRALSETQKNYSTYDRELLAIFEAVKHFRGLLEGRNFIIFTDHRPLVHAFSQKADSATPRRIRQLNYISQFSTTIEHQPGITNTVADSLSRISTLSVPDDLSALVDAQKNDQEIKNLREQDNLKFALVDVPGTNYQLLCENSTSVPRPYIPRDFRMNVFTKIHGLSHPGVRTTRKMLAKRYFWPNLNSDVAKWTRCCVSCQKAKVQRHTISHPARFQQAGRFDHIHIDIVGPLPPSRGMRYCLTMVDRFTRWPEAIPIEDMTAATIAEAFYANWVARFGVPLRITTDQGRQFESELFRHLMKILGIERCRTTAYHPQTNGCVERWHRSLKTSLMAHLNGDKWVQSLPTVLLGLRAVLREDSNVSAAEMVYGQPLRLPGEFMVKEKEVISENLFVRDLQNYFEQVRPAPFRQPLRKTFQHKDLETCTSVFLREDAVKRPLVPPYSGPYKVLKRGSKTFTIQLPGREATVSIDRLKPAFLLNEDQQKTLGNQPEQAVTATPPAILKDPTVTRYGRTVKPTVRFADSVIGGE